MLPKLTLELGVDRTGERCKCCQLFTRRVTGFVYADGSAHAAYAACWTADHPSDGVSMILSIGGYGGGRLEDRVAVALEWRAIEGGPACMVVDAMTSKWADKREMGRMLLRSQVIGTPLADQVFQITDLLSAEDGRFRSAWGVSSRPG